MMDGKRLLAAGLVLICFATEGLYATEATNKKPKKISDNTMVREEQSSIARESLDSAEENEPTLAVAPDVPDSIVFCGKTIDLTRNDMRERFDREILAMMYMHSSSLTLLKRANRYFPALEKILKDSGLPDDLKYLACIESNLNPRAVSAAKAVGMWQFMPETARQYGLEVDEDVDERYNVEKETAIACQYLKEAYAKYGDWATACASYNTGMSRITSELIKQSAANSFDLWLVEETSRYVFRILACKEFMAHPRKYGFILKKEQLYPPVQTRDTVVSTPVPNWVDFAKKQGITYYDLKNYNTWIRNDSLPNRSLRTYKVSIPTRESLQFDKKNIQVHQPNWVVGK